MNLLVCNKKSTANILKHTLNMGEEWKTCGFGCQMTGNRFKKILIIDPNFEDEIFYSWYNTVLKTRIPPEGGDIIVWNTK